MMTGRKIEDASRQPSRACQARFPLGDLRQPAIAGKRQAPGGCGCVGRENQNRDNDPMWTVSPCFRDPESFRHNVLTRLPRADVFV
jgi:hypothetical protein